MKHIGKTLLLGTAAAALSAGMAFAAVQAQATTDLNIRAGPGPQYPAVGVIDGGATATVEGCLQGSKWCRVSYNGMAGWSYSDYLVGSFSGEQVVITERRSTELVPIIEFDNQDAAVVTGSTTGAVAGALIAGPLGAAVGGVAGAAVGAAITPPERVSTFVVENRPEPVFLSGEVVVGAGIPETVTLRTIPDYEYRLAVVNNQAVLVDPGTRQIVYVYR